MHKLLITGAAGGLGRMLREKLAGVYPALRLSDIAPLDPAGENEETVTCDLGDYDAVMDLVAGCDGIVQLGGISRENSFEAILNANLRGTYHIFEAARRHGRPRILFASSNHTIGFHERTERLDGESPYRPDSLYGLSKCYGELVARYYYDKFGVESLSVRIGSCFPEPRDRRMLATWLSGNDFCRMIEAAFAAPKLGCAMLYGASANKEQWWDNGHAAFLGWTPEETAEVYRDRVEAATPTPDPNDPAVVFQGGAFAAAGHFEDE